MYIPWAYKQNASRMFACSIFLWALIAGQIYQVAEAQDDQSIEKGGVRFYFTEEPPCALARAPDHVVIRGIGGFRESVPLAVYLNSLLQRALQADRNAVYDIHIEPTPKGYGGAVSAAMGTCVSTAVGIKRVLPIESSVELAIEAAVSCDRYLFARVDRPTPERTVQAANPKFDAHLSSEKCATLKTSLLSTATYEAPRSISGSCPFIPSVGYRLVDPQTSATWLLASSECNPTITFVHEGQDWRTGRQLELSEEGRNTLMNRKSMVEEN